METQNSKKLSYLKYLKQRFNPSLVYYPGSGADIQPKKIFGNYHVIHLSLPEHESKAGYLEALGDGIKLLGDMRHSNLADRSVDLIYLTAYSLPEGLIDHSIPDFDRVLKPGGYVSLEGCGYRFANRSRWTHLLQLFKQYKKINLPNEFRGEQVKFGIHPDERDPELGGFNGWYVESEQAMKDFIISHRGQGYSGFEEILDYAVLQKPKSPTPDTN